MWYCQKIEDRGRGEGGREGGGRLSSQNKAAGLRPAARLDLNRSFSKQNQIGFQSTRYEKSNLGNFIAGF
jgi:hypothetical protein